MLKSNQGTPKKKANIVKDTCNLYKMCILCKKDFKIFGIKTYVTGHVYVGEFIEEQMHGIGHIVLDTQEGQLSSWYEGQWKHDCADGYVNHQQRENGSNFHICCTPIAVLVRHGSVLVRCPRRLPKWLMMGSGVQVARMVRAVHVHT